MLFGAYWREKPTKMHPGNASNSWSIRVGLNRHYDSRQNCAFSGISWASNNNELIPAQRLVGQQIWGTAQVTGHVIVTIRQSALPTTTVSLRNDICAEMIAVRCSILISSPKVEEPPEPLQSGFGASRGLKRRRSLLTPSKAAPELLLVGKSPPEGVEDSEGS
ncbi:hypothetical protein B0H19DRAFT_1055434 [Mycena capillaripes]|nr:hypothetical protein B0H19DRAFT_1055434 [Mycena capillaripes]